MSQNSIYIHDPKGEFARACVPYLAEVIGRLLCVLDPFGVSGPTTQAYRVCLNHLMMIDPHDKYTFMTKCKLLANALIIDELGTKEPHWNQTAEQAITFLIGHVRTYERYEGMRDLTTVALLASMLGMRDPSNPSQYLLEDELQSNTAGGGMIAYLARQFFSRTGGEFSSVISNTGKNLEWLMLEPIQECVSGPSIHLRDFVRGSMILIDCRPVLTVGDLRGWTRMQVQMLLAAHEEYSVLPGHRNFFFLDEFHSLGRLKVLETSAAYLAGFGAQLLVAIQDISQLRANFPHSWETFLANAGFIQAFSIADNASLEYLSKAMGEAATLSRSTNAPSFDQATQQAATGESWSLGSHRLMTPDEIGRFFGRDDAKLRQLILRPGYRPAILQRAFYDKHPIFAGKFSHE